MKVTNTLALVLGLARLLSVQAVTVHLYPPPAAAVPEQLDATHASLALSRHLGLEQFEKLGDGDGIWDGVLQADQQGIVGTAVRDGLLISLAEEDAREVLPQSLKTTFELPSPPIDNLLPLVNTYVHRASQVYGTIFSESSSSLSSPQAVQLLDIFSAPTEANQVFLSSTAALVDFLDHTEDNADAASSSSSSQHGPENFGAFELSGLRGLAVQYGADSEAYRTAVKTIAAVFASALSRDNIKLAVLTFPPSSSFDRRADDEVDIDGENEDEETTQSPLQPPAPRPAEPIGAVSTCFENADVCTNSTNGCSGHGECVSASKAGKTCFVCACQTTRDEKNRAEDWAGIACERKDVSGPFVLLSGTVIGLILLVGMSVGLLVTIGSGELPSVLTGGVAGSKRE